MFVHAYWMEIIQAAIAVLGVVLNIYELQNAFRDYRYSLAANMRLQRTVVAWHHVEREVINCMCQLLLLSMGVMAILMVPPPPIRDLDVTTQMVINRGAMSMISLLLVSKSLLAHRERFVLNRTWDIRRKDDLNG